MESLKPRRRKILEYIKQQTLRVGAPPTIREIAAAVGLKSPDGVRKNLKALQEAGLLEHHGEGLARGYRPVSKNQGFPVLGEVAAGVPLLAEQHLEGHLDPGSLFPVKEGWFALKVKGDSMKDAGILDGAFVIVRPDPSPPNGTIAVVLVEKEATVKKIQRRGRLLRLQPANPAFKTMEYDLEATEVRVLGRVAGTIRKS